MGSDNVFGVEPPKDANGEVIPLDTETLYETDGQVFHVAVFRYSLKRREWLVSGGYTGARNGLCVETDRLLLAPPDSWEKLIEDLRNAVEKDIATCAYMGPAGKGCIECRSMSTRNCTRNAFADIADRIEKLRGASNGD